MKTKNQNLETLGESSEMWLDRLLTLDYFCFTNEARLRRKLKRERRKTERADCPDFSRLQEIRLMLATLEE